MPRPSRSLITPSRWILSSLSIATSASPCSAAGMPAALEDLENQLVAFVAVLAEQRLDVLERGRFERLESVALVHFADHTNDVLPPPHVVGEKVSGASGWLNVGRRQNETEILLHV